MSCFTPILSNTLPSFHYRSEQAQTGGQGEKELVRETTTQVEHTLSVSILSQSFDKQLQNIQEAPFLAGNLRSAYHEWQKITSDHTIFQLVQGLQMYFIEKPFQHQRKQTNTV